MNKKEAIHQLEGIRESLQKDVIDYYGNLAEDTKEVARLVKLLASIIIGHLESDHPDKKPVEKVECWQDYHDLADRLWTTPYPNMEEGVNCIERALRDAYEQGRLQSKWDIIDFLVDSDKNSHPTDLANAILREEHLQTKKDKQ